MNYIIFAQTKRDDLVHMRFILNLSFVSRCECLLTICSLAKLTPPPLFTLQSLTEKFICNDAMQFIQKPALIVIR